MQLYLELSLCAVPCCLLVLSSLLSLGVCGQGKPVCLVCLSSVMLPACTPVNLVC